METQTVKTYKIPEKILSRKDEITADFMKLVDDHIDELMSGRVTRRLHAQDFGARLFIHPRHLTNTLKITINSSVCEVVGFPFLVRFKSIKNTVISNLMFLTVDELSVAKA